jgi:hypothetical protein
MITMAKRAFFAWLIWELVSGTVAVVGGFAYPFLVHAGIIKQDYLKILPSFILPSHAAQMECQYVIITGTDNQIIDGRLVGRRYRIPADYQVKCKDVA